ncbi:Sodium:dicarboxylate symporter, partial [Chytriomyces sp. MP71]
MSVSNSIPLWKRVLTSLPFWLFVCTVLGCVLGSVAPQFSKDAAPTQQLFLRPIQFVVFPLVFSSLVIAIAGHPDLKKLGKLAVKSIIYFEVVTTVALIIGLAAVNSIKPGEGLSVVKDPVVAGNDTFTYANWINHLTPKTWGEMMGGSGSSELLQVLVSAIIFGCATAIVPQQEHRDTILKMCRAVMAVMFKFVDIIIWSAPISVLFAIAAVVAKAGGLGVLANLGKLVATVYGTIIVFILVAFGTVMAIFKIHPIEFLVAMKEPLIIAYTTATSEAALPQAFEALDEYGVAPRVYAFVLPLGYSFNLDGSTLYLSLAAIFCAQAAGVSKTIGEQIVMVLMLMVSSKGVAGVRSASIIVLSATCGQFGIPQWPITLILGVDWFMDMARTFCN